MSELSCLHGSKRYVACDDVSRATPLRWGQGYQKRHSGRTAKRQQKETSILSVASYIAVHTVQLFSHKGG